MITAVDYDLPERTGRHVNSSTRKLTKRGISHFTPLPMGEGPVEPVGLVVTVSRWHNIGTNWILNY